MINQTIQPVHPEIMELEPKQLMGLRVRTSLLKPQDTPALWRRFMTLFMQLPERNMSMLYSVQVYDSTGYFTAFDPSAGFEKWAAAAREGAVPSDMELLELPGGMYAVFTYTGTPDAFPPFARYIFNEWLPQSDYRLDNRPHFEVMGPGYDPADPEATEKVFVPVIKKSG